MSDFQAYIPDSTFGELKPGDTILEKYLVTKVIPGGIGKIALATDSEGLHQQVALKFISDEYFDESNIERFVYEGKVHAFLSCPYIVQLFDVISYSDNFILVMEYCEEGNLRDRLANGPLSLEKALTFVLEITVGMIYLQANFPNLAHGDIKPENLLISRRYMPFGSLEKISQKEELIKIADFGLAQGFNINPLLFGDKRKPLVFDRSESPIGGSIMYMAPEQLREMTGYADIRSDIYSYGLIFYEMLTGSSPFTSITEAIKCKGDKNYKLSVSHFKKINIDNKIIRFILKATEFDAEHRYQNWREVFTDLNDIVDLVSDTTSVSTETYEKIAIKNPGLRASLVMQGLLDQSPNYTLIETKIELAEAYRIASHLSDLNREAEALQVIDTVLNPVLTSDNPLDALIELTKPSFQILDDRIVVKRPSLDITKELFKLRTECFSMLVSFARQRGINVLAYIAKFAINNARFVKELFPYDPKILGFCAQTYAYTQNHDLADRTLDEALKLEPNNKFIKDGMVHKELEISGHFLVP